MAAKKREALKPASTLVRKRHIVVPIVLVAIIVIAAVVVLFLVKGSSSQSKVLATVNGEPIYQDEIDSEYNQLPAQYQAQYSKEFILNQTIDKRLLLQEAKRRGLTVSDAEVNSQVQSIESQFGLTDDSLKKLLSTKNMTFTDYQASVREELLLSKVIKDAVTSYVQISEQELVQYYDDHPDEFKAPLGGVIVSHILVDNQSLAQDIIAKLISGASFEDLASQYSTDNGSSGNGGYIGIVTNDSQYVPEFKAAALALGPQQFTHTPVKSVYGYHIIKRLGDTEPYKLVRSRIENQLQIQKQMVLFQAFLGDLRAKAVIKLYTAQGVITQQQPGGALVGFAECVAGKATLYGTRWSEFTQQQQDLFGESFSSLKYVDCDNNASACTAANVQKYPTWIIDGQSYGQLSLSDIANKTGCALTT